jgi:hypothetical protein
MATHHRAGIDGPRRLGVFIHQRGQHFLVERTPIRADPHGLVMLDRQLNDLAELLVLFFLEADIAGIDAIFRQGFRAGRMIGQQFMADIMKIADKRRKNTHVVELFADLRHGGGSLVAIDGDPHHFRTRLRQSGDLLHRAVDVGRIRVGHALHDDGRAAADLHGA